MSKTAFHHQIAHQERLHENRALKFSKVAVEQYETAYSLCDEILYDIEANVNMKGDIDRQAIFMILVRVMGTMQSIKWLFLKGYYYDAFVLVRSFMESLGTCCYISQNKGTGERWFNDKKIGASLDMFKAIAKTLNREIPEKDTAKFYDKLCMFAHGDNWAIGSLISEVENEDDSEDGLKTIRFRNPSPYEKRWVDTVTDHPLQTLLVIQELFPEISDYDKKQITEIQSNQYESWKKLNP
jgi:hypothetical protein